MTEDFEMLGTKIEAMTAMNKMAKILEEVPKDREEEVGSMMKDVTPNIPDTFAEKIKAFKEAVGDEIFATIAAGDSLNRTVEKHFTDLAESYIKKSYKKFCEVAKEFAPDLSIPEFKHYRNAVVLASDVG